MSRDVRVRIREIAVSAGRFDEKAFRRQVRERLASHDIENRLTVRNTIGNAARRAAKDDRR